MLLDLCVYVEECMVVGMYVCLYASIFLYVVNFLIGLKFLRLFSRLSFYLILASVLVFLFFVQTKGKKDTCENQKPKRKITNLCVHIYVSMGVSEWMGGCMHGWMDALSQKEEK